MKTGGDMNRISFTWNYRPNINDDDDDDDDDKVKVYP
jgi:hypothetical protein